MNNTIPFHSAPHAPQITVDVNILSMLKQAASCLTEMVSENVYLAAIGPDMELTIIVEEDAPSILPCFDEDDALISVKGAPLFISYNPAQVLKLAGKRYLTGPVIFYRTDGHSTIVSLTVEDAFIVATHTDREHIHNHIIYNSTALDSTRKFRDFLLSGLAVQRLSDLICLEHQLSVIEIKPYRERQKRTLYPPKESNRDKLCSVIDGILLDEKTANFEAFLQKLEQQGYEIKRGKHTSVKGARQKRFIRFRTLGAGYSEDEIKAVIAGEAEHRPYQKQPPKEQPFHLLVDVQAKLSEGKSEGYARWAKRYNLKEMSKTLIFLQENKIGSIEEMQERVNAATARYHELGDSIKAAEQRMAEIAVLRAHIVNYARTRPVYDAYRKAGYSKKFLEEHREQITLHKAAKAAFDEASLKKLPKVKELDAEYATLLSQKKAAYPAYRKARDEMQELKKAQKNVELFFAEEKDPKEKSQTR